MTEILYISSHSLKKPQAASLRAFYFSKELRSHFKMDILTPFFPQPKNKSPLFLRLFGEIFLALELISRLIFFPSRLIILSSPPYITNLILGLFLLAFKKKYLFDIRDPYPEVFFEEKILSPHRPVGKIFIALTKTLYQKSQGISVATEGIKKVVERYHQGQKIQTFLNGYDEKFFFPTKDKFENFTLIFHGNLGRMQNIDLLLEMAEKGPHGLDIIVIGEGLYEGKIKNCNRLTFLGKLPHEELSSIVRKSHLGLSFRKDGLMGDISFPVKIFEYIGSGLPVISTPRNETGQFLEKNHLGYCFQNFEIDNIIKKVISLKKNYSPTIPRSELQRKIQAKKFCHFVKNFL